MARTGRNQQRARLAGLTESWDDVADSQEEDSYTEEEEVAEKEDRDSRASRRDSLKEGSSNRASRASLEPQFVMPASPNANNSPRSPTARTKTPHFRGLGRSMTSDAGNLDTSRKVRSNTPRDRKLDRSFTSDAGKFKKSKLGRVSEDEDDEDVGYLQRILQSIMQYVWEILGLSMTTLKPILAKALVLYAIVAFGVFVSGFFTYTISHSLTPLCRIPGVTTFFNPDFCPDKVMDSHTVLEPPIKDLADTQSMFDEILEGTSANGFLPLEMKKSEASIRDLRSIVEYSTLPSRNELVYEFNGFVDMAKRASSDLSKFNSRIGRAVDHILSVNRWTLKIIQGVADQDANRGSVVRFFTDHLNIFAPFQPVSLAHDTLLNQYLRHTSVVEEQVATLITEAESLLGVLNNMDERLDVINDIAVQDGIHIEASRDELFGQIWTKLGGNQKNVKKHESQITLLNNVGAFRRYAWAQVTGTIVKLQAIRDNLEDLRERVAKPEVVGADRVPLEVHIDAINSGIQRLQQQRETTRKRQDDAYQKILSRAEGGEAKRIEDREL